jgi:hypothetical protein
MENIGRKHCDAHKIVRKINIIFQPWQKQDTEVLKQ